MTTTPDDEDLPNFAAIMDYPKSMTAKALNASVRPTNATTHVHEAHSTVWVQVRNPKWLDDDHTVVNGALKIGDIWVDMDYAAYPGWEAWSGTAPFTRVFDGIDWRIMASSEESAPITAGNGLTKTGNTLDVGAGTGISVAADTVAIDTAVVARKSSTTLSTSATSYVVTHNLNTRDVQVSVVQVGSPYGVIYTAWEATSVNTVTVYFATAPTANTLRVNVVG